MADNTKKDPEAVVGAGTPSAPDDDSEATYLPPDGKRTGKKRLVRRSTGSQTLAYLPLPKDGATPPPELPEGVSSRATMQGMVPVVTVSRSTTVTVSRGTADPGALTPQYPPPPLVPADRAETALAIPALAPPKVNVSKHALEGRVDQRLVLLTRPDSAQAASFRSLRHRVAERGDPRCILVTSANAGEGRTTCAANLALALAEVRRYRVLLVEADARTPSLADVFGVQPESCLLDQIVDKSDAGESVFHVTEIEGRGLHVAVMDPKSKGKSVDGPAFRTAVERLRRAYDYVVIDAPSVLAGPEVNLIEDSAQAIVVATRSKKSRGKELQSAIEQLAPSNLLGVVLLDG